MRHRNQIRFRRTTFSRRFHLHSQRTIPSQTARYGSPEACPWPRPAELQITPPSRLSEPERSFSLTTSYCKIAARFPYYRRDRYRAAARACRNYPPCPFGRIPRAASPSRFLATTRNRHESSSLSSSTKSTRSALACYATSHLGAESSTERTCG